MKNNSLKLSRSLHLLIVAFLVVITYYAAANNGFNVDDAALLVNNSAVHGISITNLIHLFTGLPNELEYLPVRDISYAMDYSIWGLKPFGFHVSNIIYYFLVCVLLYLFVERLAKGRIPEERFLALFATALFAVHPVHVEVVAGIAQRKDLLATLFSLASFCLYLHFRETSRHRFYWAALAAFVLALFSKASVVTMPFLFVLLDAYFYRSSRFRWQDSVLRAMPFFCIAAVYTIIQSLVLMKTGAITGQSALPMIERFASVPVVYGYYIKLLALPSKLYLIHPFVLTNSVLSLKFFVASAVLIILCVVAWHFRREWPIGSFAICWFVVTILPVSGIVPTTGTLVADRYLFIPSVGFCILLALLLLRIWRNNTYGRIVGAVALLSLISAFVVISLKRVSDWRDEVTLHAANIRDFPDVGADSGLKALKARLYVLTAKACYAKKRKAETFGYLDEATRLDPSRKFDAAIFAASDAYFARDYNEAIRVLDGIDLFNKRDFFEVNFLYGKVLAAQGDYAGARASFERALANSRDLGLITVSRGMLKAELASLVKDR